jgi:hypothetical protein
MIIVLAFGLVSCTKNDPITNVHSIYHPLRIFLNNPSSITIVTNNGNIKHLRCASSGGARRPISTKYKESHIIYMGSTIKHVDNMDGITYLLEPVKIKVS